MPQGPSHGTSCQFWGPKSVWAAIKWSVKPTHTVVEWFCHERFSNATVWNWGLNKQFHQVDVLNHSCSWEKWSRLAGSTLWTLKTIKMVVVVFKAENTTWSTDVVCFPEGAVIRKKTHPVVRMMHQEPSLDMLYRIKTKITVGAAIKWSVQPSHPGVESICDEWLRVEIVSHRSISKQLCSPDIYNHSYSWDKSNQSVDCIPHSLKTIKVVLVGMWWFSVVLWRTD